MVYIFTRHFCSCNNMYPNGTVSASAPEISLDPVEHVSVSEAAVNMSK